MANYKIIIQYDGTRYKGWQRQKTTDQTIQGKIEAILSRQYEMCIRDRCFCFAAGELSGVLQITGFSESCA